MTKGLQEMGVCSSERDQNKKNRLGAVSTEGPVSQDTCREEAQRLGARNVIQKVPRGQDHEDDWEGTAGGAVKRGVTPARRETESSGGETQGQMLLNCQDKTKQ